MEAISRVMPRAIARIPRLAPLEPDAFLRWWFHSLPADARGPRALTVAEIHFELSRVDPDRTYEETRKDYLRLAARVRRNMRMGLWPLGGI